jgi:hypothetical protein
VSDGETTQDDDLMASTLRRAAELGIRIHTVSVGTVAGAPVPVDEGSGTGRIKTAPDGRPIVTHADEAKMKGVSAATAGFHAVADQSGSYVPALLLAIAGQGDPGRKSISVAQILVLLGGVLLVVDGLGGVRRRAGLEPS